MNSSIYGIKVARWLSGNLLPVVGGVTKRTEKEEEKGTSLGCS